MGAKITKWAGRAAAALSVAFEMYNWYQKHKAQKDLENLKAELTNAINDCMANVFGLFNSEEDYYKNFAPSYIEMCKRVEERGKEVEELQLKVKQLEEYKQRIDQWKKSGEYVEYTEI